MTTVDAECHTSSQSSLGRGNRRWIGNIICHLRDDLADLHPKTQYPDHDQIQQWVNQCYYQGLNDLIWEEATLSVLSRLRLTLVPGVTTIFIDDAIMQLRKSTQKHPLWTN